MAETLENLKNDSNSSHGGARPNAGRPKGSANASTIERAAAKERFLSRVHANADKLFNAQLDKAVGEKYLMVKHTAGEGKNRKSWTEIVTNPEMIRAFLDDELENNDDDFYYMTTKPADNQAIQGLLDRGFGKAQEKIDLTSNDETIGLLDPAKAAKYAEFLKSQS